MVNLYQQQQPPMPLPLRKQYSREQIRLYFFPYSARPIKELERALWRWIALVAGLGLFALLLLIWLISSLVGWVIVGIAAIAAIQIYLKKIQPIRKKLEYERSEQAKERMDMKNNPPPSEEEYEDWINAISNEVYQSAPKKLRLPSQPGRQFGDLQVRAVIRPSSVNPPSPWDTEAARIWASGLHKWHYSINIFTKFFVLEDYIAIYTDAFNARVTERTEEKSEHCFHQHVSYVSLDGQSERVEVLPGQSNIVMSHQLSMALDSGYTIKLDVASAVFPKRVLGPNGYSREDTSDTNKIYNGLLEVLNDHKKSVLRSLHEHDDG